MSSAESTGFGELLRDYRRAAGLTQEDLAEQAGLSQRSISDLERGGAHVPRRDTVALLVRALGLDGDQRAAIEASIARRRGPRGDAAAPAALVRATGPMHNLPRSWTSFVGRERELRELGRLLPTSALLGLIGAGGVGKTRLAHELVRAHANTYADGAWLVELAAVDDPFLLPSAVASTLGVLDATATAPGGPLLEYLRSRQLLLVLDACEHLTGACAELVTELLGECARLQVLITSREPLGIAGEVTWRVEPLELHAAERLFLERAQAANNSLVLTDQHKPAVARIAVGLDGLPLAIELAAARTRVLTVDQLAERLATNIDLLSQPRRIGLAHHRTIRGTIDWSHELLDSRERSVLRRLSVFAGGCTLEMAELVCAGSDVDADRVLDLLAQLVDKSMVVSQTEGQATRFRLLEPIRQYASEQLAAADELDAWRARHAAAFVALAETGAVDTAGAEEVAVLDRLEVDHDNIRVALRWTLEHSDARAAMAATAALYRMWERRGHFTEGCAWLSRALDVTNDGPTRERGQALNALSTLLWESGETSRAQPVAEEALAVCRTIADGRGMARALSDLGVIALYQDDAARAIGHLNEAIGLARQAGHAPLLSLALAYFGRALVWASDATNQRAADALHESLAVATASESSYATGHALAALGDLAWLCGEFDEAVDRWCRALEVRQRLGDRRGTAACLEGIALGLAVREEFADAAWLFGAVDAQRSRIGPRLRQRPDFNYDELRERTRRRMGAVAFVAATAAGHDASFDAAIALGLAASGFAASQTSASVRKSRTRGQESARAPALAARVPPKV